jgi:hypothetical protein
MMTKIYAGGPATPVFGFASNQQPGTSNATVPARPGQRPTIWVGSDQRERQPPPSQASALLVGFPPEADPPLEERRSFARGQSTPTIPRRPPCGRSRPAHHLSSHLLDRSGARLGVDQPRIGNRSPLPLLSRAGFRRASVRQLVAADGRHLRGRQSGVQGGRRRLGNRRPVATKNRRSSRAQGDGDYIVFAFLQFIGR